jgi:putative spermidine/putrescine transport system permease protein
MKRGSFWAWLWIGLGLVYFFLPLLATLLFSFRARPPLSGYQNVLQDPKFLESFTFSLQVAVLTIIVSLLVIVPTTYWIHLRLPRLRPFVEFVTLLPFVVPAIVLVFGLIRIYSRPPLQLTATAGSSNLLLVAAYVVLSFPYMYRAVDTGLRAIDVRTLTEAAQSLGAGWSTILFRVILPNVRPAVLSGAFLTFAIVIGEFTMASLLDRPAFGPYLQNIGANKAYEPAALAIIAFAVTWACMGLINVFGRSPRDMAAPGKR